MKRFTLLICVLFFCLQRSTALNITIIDSHTNNSGHLMDTRWQNVCLQMGHTAAIFPASKLDAIGNLSATDILIVASGLDASLTVARTGVIQQYLQSGGKVYLQSEYDASFSGNVAYASLVNALGGTFSWTGVVPNTLSPTIILGFLATDYAVTSPLPYFWYGQSINPCSSVEMILEFQGSYLGSIFCVPSSGGRLITTSDQDWVNQSNVYPASDSLMKNIVYNLAKSSYYCVNSGGVSSVSLGNDTTLCSGSTLVLNAGAGFSGYLWKGGQTGSSLNVTASGTYWIRVTSACGSIASDTINVTVQSCNLPVANLLCNDSSFCANNCINYTDLSTNNPTSWQWTFQGGIPASSTDQNPQSVCYLNSGYYDVMLIASNSNGSDTVSFSQFIAVFSSPAVPLITLRHDTLFCSFDTSIVSYQWYFNSTLISGSIDSFLVVAGNGNYNLQVINKNGCEIAVGITIAAVSNTEDIHSLTFLPNPASKVLIVKNAEAGVKNIRIYSMLGALIKSEFPDDGRNRDVVVNVEDLPPGIYFVQVLLSEGIRTGRFVKE